MIRAKMNGWPRYFGLRKCLLSDQITLAYDVSIASDHVSIQPLTADSAIKGRGRQIDGYEVGNLEPKSSDALSETVTVMYSIIFFLVYTCFCIAIYIYVFVNRNTHLIAYNELI